MDFDATGSIAVGGCASYSFTVNLPHEYEVGDIVYSKKKALKGLLRRYAIKSLQYGPTDRPPGADLCIWCNFPPLYLDTFNAYHNEEDLVTLEEAQDLIDAYLIQYAAQLEEHVMENC